MDCVITDNGNCVSTGGETVLGVDVSGSLSDVGKLGGDNFSVGSWFVDNSDRVIWSRRGGRVINVWDEYVSMLGVIRDFLFGGEFLSNDKYCINGSRHIRTAVNRHIRKVYDGCSFRTAYNMVHNCKKRNDISSNDIFAALIDYYGVDGMDWNYLFRGVKCFQTKNDLILKHIASETVSNCRIYDYFVNVYNLRVGGVIKHNRRKDRRFSNAIQLDWNGGGRTCDLSELVVDKRHAWKNMTSDPDRVEIRDYDMFLAGRDESVVMPDRCPIFGNIVLNYTGIDFSSGLKNKKRCSMDVYEGSKEVTWSFASVDRIDSTKGYTYDNIKVISEFANGLKNCYSEYHVASVLDYIRSTQKK